MANQIKWRQRRQRRRLAPDERPLRVIKSALGEMARVAFSEPFMIAVERQEIFLRKLPPALDGFRIVHLSDLHYGPMVDSRHLERAIDIANELNADLIALTGDYISQERAYAAPCAELVGRLKARHGVFAVLGNHDHWTDARLIADLFRAEGIHMLINEGMRIDARGEAFWLAGVDDTMVGLEDLSLAMAGACNDEVKLLLAHNPTILRRAARADVDLVLSGHTHGGQVTLRAEKNQSGKPRRRMLRGLGRRAGTQIYVTRGLGMVVLPIRYGCPPEVSLLELRCLSHDR
ncbi:MAG TPA: metallophosphoesterase [Pyrinomonadaceae bacterium]|nr:metallophosphoesterase [Pyrinomonadaceae bacterium]